MPREGMHSTVHHHRDPTYEAVVAKFKKEEKAAAKKKETMKPFRVFATIQAIIRRAGYRLVSEIVLEDEHGHVFRHGYDRGDK